MSGLYERDFYAWASQQAALLRAGRIEAASETGLGKKAFPEICPWSAAEIMDEAFWPGAA